MSAREQARQLWNHPAVQSILEEGFREARRLKSGWCRTQFIRAGMNRRGRVGATELLRQFIPRVEGSALKNQYGPQILEFLLFGLEQTLPPCKHRGRRGEASLCSWNYPIDPPKSPTSEPLERERGAGFKPLLPLMREAGKKEGK
jgi:hypothetical protein